MTNDTSNVSITDDELDAIEQRGRQAVSAALTAIRALPTMGEIRQGCVITSGMHVKDTLRQVIMHDHTALIAELRRLSARRVDNGSKVAVSVDVDALRTPGWGPPYATAADT